MGNGAASKSPSPVPMQFQQNEIIEKQLRAAAREEASTVKLLLLGAGESGKSTILKQMKILHGNGFSRSEVSDQVDAVRRNLLECILALLQAMKTLEIPFDCIDNEEDAKGLLKKGCSMITSVPVDISSEVLGTIIRLWYDSGIQSCFSRSNEFQINDSAQYFLDNTARICTAGYVPNEQDMLRTRVQTNGIVEVNFNIRRLKFRVFDVGGQKSQRRKWLHCFDNAKAIVYVAAISEYDQLMREDEQTNRLCDALELFSSVINNQYFKNTNIILFLNKKDIFEDKIRQRPLHLFFPHYAGKSGDYAEGAAFLLEVFQRRCNASGKKDIYDHFTCATDTQQVKHVLDSTIDIITASNLKESGFPSA